MKISVEDAAQAISKFITDPNTDPEDISEVLAHTFANVESAYFDNAKEEIVVSSGIPNAELCKELGVQEIPLSENEKAGIQSRVDAMNRLQELCEGFGLQIRGAIQFQDTEWGYSEYERNYTVEMYPGAMYSKIDGNHLCNDCDFNDKGSPEWKIDQDRLQ